MISFEELKNKIEGYGYFATDSLLYDLYNSLVLFGTSGRSKGQDIFAICLEGPPGSGKTEYAKVYTKLTNELFGNVELVSYQCDATTGKTELFEDINISAAIRGDADNVNIPGKLVEAIKKVNEGKKVILFIDEYDKAREETDAFLLQFLQSGRINSTQHGDLEVKEEYKGNLQVILCKNDMREELSGPLSRRIRISRLEYMKPEIFYKVANRALVVKRESPVNDGLINLVTLMYEKAYANSEMYNRLPSCSEMLTALEDADRLLKSANAPKNIIYNIIIRNMFKSPDDIATFESSLDKVRKNDESKLSDLVKAMKTPDETSDNLKINNLIAKKVFDSDNKSLLKSREEMENLIDKYKKLFAQLEADKKREAQEEIMRIKLQNGELVTNNKPNAISNFDEESANVKREKDIFNLSSGDWTEVATVNMEKLYHNFFVAKLMGYSNQLGIKIYKNGVLLKDDGNLKLIMVADDPTNYKIMSNCPIIPSNYLYEIHTMLKFMIRCFRIQMENTKNVAVSPNQKFEVNALVYSENDLLFDHVGGLDDVYHVFFEKTAQDESDLDLFNQLSSKEEKVPVDKVIELSKKLMDSQNLKELKHE